MNCKKYLLKFKVHTKYEKIINIKFVILKSKYMIRSNK